MHAYRVLRTRLSAMVGAVLDPGITFLQYLRKAAGFAQAGEDDAKSRKDRPGARPEPAAPSAAAPAATAATKPKRRLRAMLVYLSVLLAGGMGGGVLAYDLLDKLLIYHFTENRRLEAAFATQSWSAETTRQTLEETQSKHSEAEKQLAALRAEHAKLVAEGKDKLVLAPTRAETLRAGHVPVLPANAVNSSNCKAIAGNDLNALMDCIHKFNR